MAAVAAHPQLVGNAFVSQYYNVLHHSQHVVHRFYTDMSCLTRAECGPEGPVETVYSQNGIYDKIMSVDYSELRAEIKTVDCQDSYSGSVLVMVTGSLSNKSQRKRDFVQTFFLAPQEKGYYVLNDVFRYLDDPQAVNPSMSAVQESAPAPPAAPVGNADESHGDPNESVLAVAEEETTPEEVYDVPDVEEVEVETAPEEMAQPSEATPPASSEVEATPSADDGQGDYPKKSYASILGGPAAQKPPAPAVEKPMASPSPQATPASAPAPPPSIDHVEETEHADATNGRSVYVKNLAVTITDPQLEEALRRFGAVKSVSIKRPQNFSYAFVEFEEVSAARAAVEASPIQIDGKTVHIEEKRPMASRSFRGRGRGRAEGNRGGGRSSGGYYSGGGRGGSSNSGAGRGSYSNEAGGSGRGGRGGGYRGSYHSNSNNNSNHNNNSNNSSEERYQPQQQQQQRYENQSQNGGGAQAHQQSSSSRRKHYRNAPFSRGSSGGASAAGGAPAPSSSAVTAP